MKTILIGGAYSNFHSIALSLLVTATDLFHCREQDIFVMTDEEKSVGTEYWPFKENNREFLRGVPTYIGKINKCSCGLWTILFEMQRLAMPLSSSVSFCATSSSLVDLISVDAGHCGRNDVGTKCACA